METLGRKWKVNDESFKREASFDVGGVNRGKAKSDSHREAGRATPPSSSRPGPPTDNSRGAYSGVRPPGRFVTKHSSYLLIVVLHWVLIRFEPINHIKILHTQSAAFKQSSSLVIDHFTR